MASLSSAAGAGPALGAAAAAAAVPAMEPAAAGAGPAAAAAAAAVPAMEAAAAGAGQAAAGRLPVDTWEAGGLRVRAADRADAEWLLESIRALAEYEGFPAGPTLALADLLRDGFGPAAWFECAVAERGGRRVGYALYNRAYSSWTARALYLEDLWVEAAARRGGAGRALLAAVAAAAARARVTRLDWHVAADNAPARAFYRRLGARDLRRTEGRLALRLDAPQLRALAAAAAAPAAPAAPAAAPAAAPGPQ